MLSSKSRANSKKQETFKRHYADLDQFVRLSNLPGGGWPDPQELEVNQAAFNELNESTAKAFDLELKKLIFRDSILQPVWLAACEQFAPLPDDPLWGYDPKLGSEIAVIRRQPIKNDDSPVLLCVFNRPEQLYAVAYAARQALRLLATQEPKSVPMPLALPSSNPEVQVMPDGSIEVLTDPFRDVLLPALQGRNVQRLRICPVEACGKLFLSKRVHQVGCSFDCANQLRVKNFRDKNPDYYTAKSRRDRRDRKQSALLARSHRKRKGK